MPILVIDESRFSLRLLVNMLKKSGLSNVTTGATPLESWEALDQNPNMRLMITALRLPEAEDGLELIRMVRRRFPATALPIVVISNSTDGHHVEAAREAGANDYIFKPVSPEALETRLRVVLDLPITPSQKIGEYLVQRGLITDDQRTATLRYQRMYSSDYMPISTLALYLDFIEDDLVSHLFLEQRFDDKAFLRRARELGLSEQRMQRLIEIKRQRRLRFGDALVKLRFVRREVLETAMKQFYKRE